MFSTVSPGNASQNNVVQPESPQDLVDGVATSPKVTAENNVIKQRISIKEKKLEDIKKQCSELIFELDDNQDPEAIVKKHISQLKKYNELKDIALGLVTMIADQRKLRTSDILEEMKVQLGDD